MALRINISEVVLKYLRSSRVHIIIWLIFIFYEVLIAATVNGRFGTLANYAIHYTINISLFYFHGAVVLPKIFKKKKGAYWLMILCTMFEAVIYIYIVYNLDLFLIKHTDILGNVSVDPTNLFARIIWRGIYFILFGTGYYFFSAYVSTRKVKEEMEKEKLLNTIQREKMAKDLMIAKNAYLKAQINPHFLFNTLDFVYHAVVQHSPKSGEAVLGLVDIMRFAIDVEHYGEYITVGVELIRLEKLIELHRLTSNGKQLINLSYEEEVKQIKIIPLVILTLVENMFKHGNLKETTGDINISKVGGYLYITTINLIHNEKQKDGFGSGLLNIKERLSSTYSELAQLKFMAEGSYFKVEVTIPANE